MSNFEGVASSRARGLKQTPIAPGKWLKKVASSRARGLKLYGETGTINYVLVASSRARGLKPRTYTLRHSLKTSRVLTGARIETLHAQPPREAKKVASSRARGLKQALCSIVRRRKRVASSRARGLKRDVDDNVNRHVQRRVLTGARIETC